MTEVKLHVYHVTNSGSEKTDNTIMQINKFFKDRFRLGGIFHSAVEVHGNIEWSFGFSEHGSGVFFCPSGKNQMYTYCEAVVLGHTALRTFEVDKVLQSLSKDWPGQSYDLLSKNCNHFCIEFCNRLGVPKPPGWINRFANAGDAAIEVAYSSALMVKQAKNGIVSASKGTCDFVLCAISNCRSASVNSNRMSLKFQALGFKNIIGSKPSNSSEIDGQDADGAHQKL